MTAEPSYLIRMSAARWQALADLARAIVPDDERPVTARLDSDWQRNVLLRWLADGKARVVVVGDDKGGRMTIDRAYKTIDALRAELATVTAERDAAVAQLETVAEALSQRVALADGAVLAARTERDALRAKVAPIEMAHAVYCDEAASVGAPNLSFDDFVRVYIPLPTD